VHLAAEDITFRAGTMPVFFLSGYEGDLAPSPLREIEAGYRSQNGAEILTRWDLFQLINEPLPEGTDAELIFGGYSKRGPALGTNWKVQNRAAPTGNSTSSASTTWAAPTRPPPG
jgi:hypothetical protein